MGDVSVGRVRQVKLATASVVGGWNEPDQFERVNAFLREQGLLRPTRMIMAVVVMTAGLVPLTMLFGLRRPSLVLLMVDLTGLVVTAAVALMWLTRWPTRRRSAVAAIAGSLCIAGYSLAQVSPTVAALACTAEAITGGYLAFFHGNKLLAMNFGVTVGISGVAACRIAPQAGNATAAAAFWLIWFVNLSVPLAIRAMSRALLLYAARSNEDSLTGLLNRRAFDEMLTWHLASPAAQDTHLTVIMVDLDNFKLINDTHGHAAGDRTLVAVAQLLGACISHRAAICRAGGEEFLIAFTSPTPDPSPIAQRLCTSIASLSPRVTASIGSTSVELRTLQRPASPQYVEQLIGIADRSMYAAKRDGGDCARHD